LNSDRNAFKVQTVCDYAIALTISEVLTLKTDSVRTKKVVVLVDIENLQQASSK